MKTPRLLALLGLICLVAFASCSPAASQSRVEQAVAATFAAQTQIAYAVQQTMAAVPPGSVENQGGAVPTNTTGSGLALTVSVSVSIDTNCRTGPGTAYPIVGALMVGESAEVVGRSWNSDNWIIQNPDGEGTCWLWAQYATVSGDAGSLPVVQTPPTPTPVAGFTVAYQGTYACGMPVYFMFQIVNTGSVTFRSFRVDVYDATTSTTVTWLSDWFTEKMGCTTVHEWEDVEPGEMVVAGNIYEGSLLYSPTGHNFTATFTLYELDGLGGQSVVNSVSFVGPSE